MIFSRIYFFRAACFLLAAASMTGLGAQQIVYDNTTTFLERFVGEPREFGDEIELSGSARTLTEISFSYFGDFVRQGDEVAKVRLYTNEKPYDNFRNEPTTVLYESDFFGINPGYNSAILPGLYTLLPNVVTFTVEFRGLAENENAGLLLYGPPTVGRSYNEFWRRNEAERWEAVIYSRTDPSLKAKAAIRLKALEIVRVSSIKVFPGQGTMQLVTTGLSGTNYIIESSTNLKTWSGLATRLVPGPTATFTTSIPSAQPRRFFRVRVP
jgi:hypothetical protein